MSGTGTFWSFRKHKKWRDSFKWKSDGKTCMPETNYYSFMTTEQLGSSIITGSAFSRY